jgi:hypothetical protein
MTAHPHGGRLDAGLRKIDQLRAREREIACKRGEIRQFTTPSFSTRARGTHAIGMGRKRDFGLAKTNPGWAKKRCRDAMVVPAYKFCLHACGFGSECSRTLSAGVGDQTVPAPPFLFYIYSYLVRLTSSPLSEVRYRGS